MSRHRVVFYVQHLLGIGHLRRAESLTQAMAAAGLDVTVALGSQRIPEVPFAECTVVQLPHAGIRGENFSQLVDSNGQNVTDEWKARRRDMLLAAAREIRPHIVLFELFPFGRRQFRFELLPLLDMLHAQPRPPKIVASVRDILVASPKAGRAEEAAETVRRYFDLVLVHGDARVIPFETTFPPAAAIADLIRYTGYVATPITTSAPPAAAGEVIVSSGGGATGAPVFAAALVARPMTTLQDLVWRILTGPDLPAQDFDRLAQEAGTRTIVKRFEPDLAARLQTCALSISRAGYNTTMDILQSGAPAVVIPYETVEETEQRLRADLLARKGLLTVLPAAELTPGRLAEAIERTVQRRKPEAGAIDLDGARETARVIADLVEQHATRQPNRRH